MAGGSLAWVRRLSFVAVLIVVAFAPGPAAARPRFTGCGPRHADRPHYGSSALPPLAVCARLTVRAAAALAAASPLAVRARLASGAAA